ncbi:acetyltransferase [Erythrobacter sp. SG61-1L]|nr:acetyltransferase [Erythrobacter sp. SG61-1L]
MTLREATQADIPALAALGRDSFVAKFGHIYSQENLDAFLAETFSEEAIGRELADEGRLYRLAFDEAGELAGYCKIAFKSAFPDHARGQRAMELKQLYAAPDRVGQGIGALLMDWAMDQFRTRGADEVHLSVFSENPGAHKFYRRYGFDKLADIYFWVGDHRDDEFLFARML